MKVKVESLDEDSICSDITHDSIAIMTCNREIVQEPTYFPTPHQINQKSSKCNRKRKRWGLDLIKQTKQEKIVWTDLII